MSTSPEGAAVFFKTWKSTFVGHLELQSMSYRVGTPCIQTEKAKSSHFDRMRGDAVLRLCNTKLA